MVLLEVTFSDAFTVTSSKSYKSYKNTCGKYLLLSKKKNLINAC